MKEFVEKLIEKLEKEYEYQLKKADECEKKEAFEMISVSKSRRKNAQCFDAAIQVVNQLADEYNNGWIPCSERLPKLFEKVQVTFLGFHDNKPYSNGSTAFIDETGSWCWVKGSHNVNVQIIAWRENLAPYQPKGE